MSSYKFLSGELRKYKEDEYKFNLRTKKTWQKSYNDQDYQFHPEYKILFYKNSLENLSNLDLKLEKLNSLFHKEYKFLVEKLTEATGSEYTGVYIDNTNLPWWHYNKEYDEWCSTSYERSDVKYLTQESNALYNLVLKINTIISRKGLLELALDFGIRKKIYNVSNYNELTRNVSREKIYRLFNDKTYILRFPSGREYIYGFLQNRTDGRVCLQKIIWASNMNVISV